jgi:hypothetical protein
MSETKAKEPINTIDDFCSDDHEKPVLVVRVDDSRTAGPDGWLSQIREGIAAVHPGLVNFFKSLYGEQLANTEMKILSEKQIDYYRFLQNRTVPFGKVIEPCTFPYAIFLPSGAY